MDLSKLRSDLKRYNMKRKYTLAMAVNLIVNKGYTLHIDYTNKVNYRVMYEGRDTGMSLVQTTNSWFVV